MSMVPISWFHWTGILNRYRSTNKFATYSTDCNTHVHLCTSLRSRNCFSTSFPCLKLHCSQVNDLQVVLWSTASPHQHSFGKESKCENNSRTSSLVYLHYFCKTGANTGAVIEYIWVEMSITELILGFLYSYVILLWIESSRLPTFHHAKTGSKCMTYMTV